MIPVVFSSAGGSYKIVKIASEDKVKKHLENLGIHIDDLTINELANNGKGLASKIIYKIPATTTPIKPTIISNTLTFLASTFLTSPSSDSKLA